MQFARIVRALGTLGMLAVAVSTLGTAATAYPKYAMKEKKSCTYCHVAPGKERNFRGLYYKAHDLSFAAFDETYESKAAGVAANTMAYDAVPKNASYPDVKVPAALNFVVKDIDGNPVNLARYSGDVILLVNVASKCGNTPQYASMEKLFADYKAKGFVVLGFPANDFGMQEPGTNAEIKEFCSATYKVAFPMFSKITVKGDAQAPVYKFLTEKTTDPMFSGPIEWNFAKFLINRKGELVARFPAKSDPIKNADVFDAIKKEIDTPLAPTTPAAP